MNRPILCKLLNPQDGRPVAFVELAEASIGKEVNTMAGENWTMWLNITNFALGIVTLIALLVVFFAVSWDLLVRKVGRAPVRADLSNLDAELQALLHGGSHSLSVPGLGLTMADGGESVESSERESSNQKSKE
jgi:hypothetical protein